MAIKDTSPWLELTLNALATGTFIYVGATEVVSDELDKDITAGGARAEVSSRATPQSPSKWAHPKPKR